MVRVAAIQRALPNCAFVILSTLILAGVLALWLAPVNNWIQPRLGVSWLYFFFPSMYLASWCVGGGSRNLFYAGTLTLGVAGFDFFCLWKSGTVAAVKNELFDQLHSAWFWQVGLLIILALGLLWSAISGEQNPNAEDKGVEDELPKKTGFSDLHIRRQIVSKWNCFLKAPLAFQLFLAFSACGTIAEWSIFFTTVFSQSSAGMPQFGKWSHYGISVGLFAYSFPLLIAFAALSENAALRKLVFLSVKLLIAFGATSLVLECLLLKSQFNLMLKVSRVVFPLFWAAMLLSPAMLDWSKVWKVREYRPKQISLADLVYFVTVVAIAIAAWMALINTI